jgi:hypothetical protein
MKVQVLEVRTWMRRGQNKSKEETEVQELNEQGKKYTRQGGE